MGHFHCHLHNLKKEGNTQPIDLPQTLQLWSMHVLHQFLLSTLAEAPETGTATSPAQREMCTCRHSTCSVTNSHLELKNNPDHTDPQKPPAPLCSSRHTQFTASQVNTARASAIQHLYQKPGKWKNMHNMYSCKSL